MLGLGGTREGLSLLPDPGIIFPQAKDTWVRVGAPGSATGPCSLGLGLGLSPLPAGALVGPSGHPREVGPSVATTGERQGSQEAISMHKNSRNVPRLNQNVRA